MSSGKELETPHTLASLPKPIDPVNGRTLASTVYSLSAARKRKRSELAVSVDGDGISLFDVQAPRLITSYALPPQSSFTAPPFSVYLKANKQRSAKRFTYAAVKESSGSSRHQILCFSEEIHTTPTGNPDKTAYTIPPSSGKVFSIDALPLKPSDGASEDTHDILVLFENGQVDCLSANLQTVKWSTNVLGASDKAVEFSAYTDAATAKRGLFKSREDAIAALDPTGEAESETLSATTLLCLVARPADEESFRTDGRSLYVCAVRPKTTGGITINKPTVQSLLTLNLPRSHIDSQADSQPSYSLHVSSGLLYQLASGSIVTYDFSTTVPQLKSELTVPGTPLQNFVRVSSSLLMAASPISCALYDVKYNSVQAILPLGSEKNEESQSRKRKQPVLVDAQSPLVLLHYVAELGLVVGLANDELIGLQVGAEVSSKRSKVRGGLLIDAIGKGVGRKPANLDAPSTGSHPLGVCLLNPADTSSKAWHRTRKQLDEFITDEDVKNFEETFAQEVGIQLRGKSAEEEQTNGTKDVEMADGSKVEEPKMNGVDEDDDQALPEWDFPDTPWDINLQTKRHKAVYLLSKVFDFSSAKREIIAHDLPNTPLRIRFFPPNAFQWLIWTGFLTTDMIRQAMRQESTGLQTISPADVIASILNFDPGMQLLCDVLRGHPGLDVDLVVQAIKALVKSLETESFPEIKGQLTNRPEQSESRDEESADKEFDAEADAAAWALARAESFVDSGILIRSHSLLEALTKLHTFPAPLVSQTLRKSLTHKEIIFLINILRLELHEGGWINTYLQDGPHDSAEFGDPSDRAIAIIADLLGCALDAIGAAGWLTSGNDAKADTIQALRMEVSAALEGIHEAAFMKGLLNDFLRFGWKRKTVQHGPSDKRVKEKGKPLTLQQADAAETRILPLGFKVEGRVQDSKVGLNGEVKPLTKREIGHKISMRVGKYSFERIDV
ncbi:hypothetical protein BFW01_g10574 [Lasiodiplodia theobromae]|uniref:Utp8 beta-propeller domain-containing protein n=1 Tax=Lasiodiplodia theobromae TaxID=45133 RepID=A0A8H7IPJ7_9PEZI|nr:uncharacterized protein LTHEOB_6522 [Lasiodiplodia theobromae]KAF4543856.1 hypothetical protein LTHEOB_6522 [Lasiodiplodia theobromae]KAF9629371.1 hypothetical protein BFW01_g10574 [Lasiodiplodia theobromae]